MASKLFKEIETNKLYTNTEGFTVRREYEGSAPNGDPFDGLWVLRHPDGKYIAHDCYRSELESKFTIVLP